MNIPYFSKIKNNRSIIMLINKFGLFILLVYVAFASTYYIRGYYPPKGIDNYISFFEPNSMDERSLIWLASRWPDHLIVGVHGARLDIDNRVYAEDRRNKQYKYLTAKALNREILYKQKLLSDKSIILVMCEAGGGRDSFASKLSSLMSNHVIATPEYFVTDLVGHFRTTSSGLKAVLGQQIGRMHLDQYHDGIVVDSIRKDG